MSKAGNPPAGEQGSADGWARVTSLSIVDLVGLLFRQLPLMLIIFLVIFVTGMFGVLQLKKSYTANGRILVQYGEEYIYNPLIGTAGQGAAYSTDQMIQAEVGFFTSVAVREQVLKSIGMKTIFPDLAKKYEAEPDNRAVIRGKALEEMSKNMGAYTAPNQPLISVSYRNHSPQVAAQVLKALMQEYQVYRRQVLLDSEDSSYGRERLTTEKKLGEVNSQLEAFLKENGISDFEGERQAANERLSNLSDQLLAAKARQREVQAELRARTATIATIPQEVVQYTDDASSGELAQARLKREQLLAKYRPDSQPVQAADAEIKRLSDFIAEGKNKNLGTIRTGVNPVYQDLLTQKLNLEAEAQSVAGKISILQSQIAQVKTQQIKFQKLSPEYQGISSRVEVLQETVKNFSAREEQFKARQNLAELASNNIRVIEWPVIPFQGSSMKKPAAVLVFLFAGFTALMAGLAKVFAGLLKTPKPMPAKPTPASPTGGSPGGSGPTGKGPGGGPTRRAPPPAKLAPANPVPAKSAAPRPAQKPVQPAPMPPKPRQQSAAPATRPGMTMPPAFHVPPGDAQATAQPTQPKTGPGGLPVLANIAPRARA